MKSRILLVGLLASCSPLKSTPNEEKHQLELTIRNLQTNVDDLRHDLNCTQTEIQILDGRIKYYENTLSSLKQQEIEKQQQKLDQLLVEVKSLEKKLAGLENAQQGELQQMHRLKDHANETASALMQFKTRIVELEESIQGQQKKFEEVGKLKGHFEDLARHLGASQKIYRVRPGDSLEKIARQHKTTVERIKQLNGLQNDLIVAGQELKIE